MPFDIQSTDKDDHYVAFLSSGINPTPLSFQQQINKKKQRASKLGSRLAKFTTLVIVLFLFTAALIVFYPEHQPTDDPTKLSANASTGLFKLNTADLKLSLDHFAISYIPAFEKFMVNHGKVYTSLQEKKHRLEVFAKNLIYIDLHNSQNFTYSLAANSFADLTFDEFKARHFTGYRKRPKKLGAERNIDWSLLSVDEASLPKSVDWNDKGCVTKIKDQRDCGSCWAFSAAGAIEGAYCLKYGKLTDLSSQQMVDCAGAEGNLGCEGGEMDDAFQYVINHGGLCRDTSYPYTARDDECRSDDCSSVVKIAEYGDVPRSSDRALKAAIALKGPVAVAIQADQAPFQFYHDGVFDGPCGLMLNHGVLAIGYGRDDESKEDYWLVKNSWGSAWGDKGFIKMVRNDRSRGGKCGVLLDASFPIVE